MFAVLGPPNTSAPGGTRLMEGYVALSPRRHWDREDRTNLQIAGVSWIWVDRGWQRLEMPFPRARLVSRTARIRDYQPDLKRIDPAIIALAAEDRIFPQGPPGAASLLLDRPGRIRIRTEATASRFLVLSEAFHDGWTVAIDGRPARVVRTYGDFLGCEVGPGVHEVAFRFDPPSDRLGSSLSFMGFLAIALIQAVAFAKPRRFTPGPREHGSEFDRRLDTTGRFLLDRSPVRRTFSPGRRST